jgi:protein TonB
MALAVAINILIIIALLGINGPRLQRPEFKGSPTLLDLSPEVETAASPSKQTAPKPQHRPRPPSPTPPPVKPPPPIPTKNPLPFIELTREEFAASDIAKLGTRGAAAGAAGQQLPAAGDSEKVGTAPNGEPLYAAEWYRRPTYAQLSAYLPARMPSEGWGLVACKTAARFRVEDCVELGNSPPGSHLAGAVRQAAWQFLVRPPRVGGKELIGTWVRIRIDYSSKAEEE